MTLRADSVRQRMALVMLALTPAIACQAWASGPAPVLKLLAAMVLAWMLEAIVLLFRGIAPGRFLRDLSAPLAAMLLVLSLVPDLPWHGLAIAVFVAIAIAKHAFGGLGENIFNPAMAGAAVVLALSPSGTANAPHFDAWMAGAFLVGGIFLLWRRVISWHAPLATLASAGVAMLALSLAGLGGFAAVSAAHAIAVLLFASAFIVTDPVSGCVSSRGRILFGIGVGSLMAIAGSNHGGMASSLPFAVLLMNALAPWLDRRTRRTSPAMEAA